MSYSILIFHASVKASVDAGKELDAFEHTEISQADASRFQSRLGMYGYSLESENPRSREYVKHVEGCPIQVAMFPTEIVFTVPYWNGSKEAIFTALQDASELSDSDGTVLFNPQEGEWEL